MLQVSSTKSVVHQHIHQHALRVWHDIAVSNYHCHIHGIYNGHYLYLYLCLRHSDGKSEHVAYWNRIYYE